MKIKKSGQCISIIGICIAFGTPAVSEELGLEALSFQLEVAREELSLPINQLEEKYDQALERLEQETQAAGQLQELLAVRKERDGFRDGEFPTKGVSAELERLREIFVRRRTGLREVRATEEKRLIEGYLPKFERLKVELTKVGEFEKALAVAEAVEQIENGRRLPVGEDRGSLVWRLEGVEDGKTGTGCIVEKDGDEFILNLAPGVKTTKLESGETIAPPFVAKFRVATTSTNIRIYYSAFLSILNHESGRTSLQVSDPAQGRAAMRMIPGEGRVSTDEFHDIELGVTESRWYLSVNGKVKAEGVGDYRNIEAPVGIGPAFGSRLRLKQFEISRP